MWCRKKQKSFFLIRGLTTGIQYEWDVTRKDPSTGDRKGKWNHLIIIQIISEQRTLKALHYVSKAKNPAAQCIHSSESTNEKSQKFTVENNITRTLYFTHRIAATLYTLETCLFQMFSNAL